MNFLVMTVILVLSCGVSAELNEALKPSEKCNHDSTTFRCVKFVKNYDADTITFDIPDVHPLLGKKISVRVLGVDSPEIKGHLPCEKDAARTAQRFIENQLVNAKVVNIENVSRDKYFRILGNVTVDGKSLTELLLKNKLAYVYNGGTKEKIDWCAFGKTRATASEQKP